VEAHVASTLLLGRVLGQEARARKLADLYRARVAAVTQEVAGIAPDQRPKVYIEVGYEGPEAFGNTYGNVMWGALVKQAGGRNIAEGVIDRWGPINPELVIAEDPDIIIITGSFWPKQATSMKLGYYADPTEARARLAAFTQRPGWERLRAVRNGRVYAIHHALSRHIYDSVALEFFAKIFHPDRFADLDPEESFRAFHEDFLPVDYGGLWMMKLEE
jgi:iron complex transport system substrate-binding protein